MLSPVNLVVVNDCAVVDRYRSTGNDRCTPYLPTDRSLPGYKWFSQWEKVSAAFDAVVAREKHSGVSYDYVVRARLDMHFWRNVSDWLVFPFSTIQVGNLLPGYPWFMCNDHFAVVPRKDASVYFRAHTISLLPCVPAAHIVRYACHHPEPVFECFLSYALISSNISYSGFLPNQAATPMPPGGPNSVLWSIVHHIDQKVNVSDIDTWTLLSVAKLKERAPEFERLHKLFTGWDEDGRAVVSLKKGLGHIQKLSLQPPSASPPPSLPP